MTETVSLNTEVSAWLAAFDSALAQGDIPAALALFVDDCYWRDLIAFTWNIKTMEGKPAIGAMLEATLAHTQPSQWQVDGEAEREAGGVLRCFFTFATAIGRGQGI